MKFAVIIAVVILCSGCLLDVGAVDPCSSDCFGTQALVCGSDGVVYRNGCEFSCAQSKNSKLISVPCKGTSAQ
ncbi:hypothetical protein CHUAL_012605 [Chamberlinius hualienensis]